MKRGASRGNVLSEKISEVDLQNYFNQLHEAVEKQCAEQAALLTALQLQQKKYARQEELLQRVVEQLQLGVSSTAEKSTASTPGRYNASKVSTPEEGELALELDGAVERDSRVAFDIDGEGSEATDSQMATVNSIARRNSKLQDCSRPPSIDPPGDSAVDCKVDCFAETPSRFVGTWMDPDCSYYSGTAINIWSDQTWRPENPRSEGQRTATYTMEPISDSAVRLIETRLDTSTHLFLARVNEDVGSLDISMPSNPSLAWSLVRMQDRNRAELGLASRLERDDQKVQNHSSKVSRSNSSLEIAGYTRRRLSQLAMRVITARLWDGFIGTVILANSICIGLQMHYELGPPGPDGMPTEQPIPDGFIYLENIFLIIYVSEIILHLAAKGWKPCFSDQWFIFDFSLVVTGAGSQWVVEPIIMHSSSTGNQSDLEQVLILRLLRLLRLLRAVRGMRRMKTPWRLVTGMISSTSTMLSTLGLLMLILYTFSCIGVEMITKDTTLWKKEGDLMSQRFASLGDILCSLVQFVTMDSLSSLYIPLIRSKPTLILFFLPILMTVSVVLMNLVTAVIVESAMDRATQDREIAKVNARQQIRRLRPVFADFFRRIDVATKGYVQVEDLNDYSLDDLPEELRPHIKVDTMMDLFWVLDIDGTGKVDENDFVDGLMNFALDYDSKATIETILLLKVLKIVTMINGNTVFRRTFINDTDLHSVSDGRGTPSSRNLLRRSMTVQAR